MCTTSTTTLHAAQLQTTWAKQQDLLPLGNPQGFYTGDRQLHSPFAQTFEVVEVVGWDDRKVRQRLRAAQCGHRRSEESSC